MFFLMVLKSKLWRVFPLVAQGSDKLAENNCRLSLASSQ